MVPRSHPRTGFGGWRRGSLVRRHPQHVCKLEVLMWVSRHARFLLYRKVMFVVVGGNNRTGWARGPWGRPAGGGRGLRPSRVTPVCRSPSRRPRPTSWARFAGRSRRRRYRWCGSSSSTAGWCPSSAPSPTPRSGGPSECPARPALPAAPRPLRLRPLAPQPAAPATAIWSAPWLSRGQSTPVPLRPGPVCATRGGP